MVKGLWTAILLLEEWGTTQWVVRGRCLTGRLLLIVPVVRGRGVSIMARHPHRRTRRIRLVLSRILVMRADCSSSCYC